MLTIRPPNLQHIAGAQFAEYILQAAYGNGKGKIVQSYVYLDAAEGGAGIKKEIGSDLDYFSVSVQLGVSRSAGSLPFPAPNIADQGRACLLPPVLYTLQSPRQHRSRPAKHDHVLLDLLFPVWVFVQYAC